MYFASNLGKYGILLHVYKAKLRRMGGIQKEKARQVSCGTTQCPADRTNKKEIKVCWNHVEYKILGKIYFTMVTTKIFSDFIIYII